MTDSDDLTREHAYLVARGVRPIALIGHHLVEDDLAIRRTRTRLASEAVPGALPFVCLGRSEAVDYGYAGSEWARDLYCWLASVNDNAVPAEHRHRILGLLLGYDRTAIEAFEHVSALPERAAR